MKNLKKEFVVQILVVIVILVIGFSVYYSSKNKPAVISVDNSEQPVQTSEATTSEVVTPKKSIQDNSQDKNTPVVTVKVDNVTAGTSGGPAISSIVVKNVSSDVTSISWVTSEPATTKISYSTDVTFPIGKTLFVDDLSLSNSHAIDLTHLNASTTYYYVISSTNSSGGVISSKSSFITATQ